MLQTWRGIDLQSTVRSMQLNARNSSRYTRIENLDCILTYNTLLGNHSDFMMVSTAMPTNNNSLLAYGMSKSATWDIGYVLCADGTQFDCGRLANLPSNEQMKTIQDWNIGGYKIEYCLSSRQPTNNLCSVEYSFSIILGQSLSSVGYTVSTMKQLGSLTWGCSCVHIQPLQMHSNIIHCIIHFKPQKSSVK